MHRPEMQAKAAAKAHKSIMQLPNAEAFRNTQIALGQEAKAQVSPSAWHWCFRDSVLKCQGQVTLWHKIITYENFILK